MLRFALVGFLLALAACGQASKKEFIVTGPDEKKYRVSAPATAAEADAIRFIAETKYGIRPPEQSSVLTYNGDTCLSDCGGHEAGYEWAQEHGISDPDDCGGNSLSFEEGCRAYAEENEY